MVTQKKNGEGATKNAHSTGELATIPQKQPSIDIAQLMTLAVEKQLPVETMERLFDLRAKMKAEFAKEEFDAAMAAFQRDCPVIAKTKAVHTNSGQLAYRYAPLETIVAQVKDVLARHGFSYQIKTETKEGMVKAICIVKHVAGHSEQSEMEVPLGNKTNVMSASQVTAAATTFAKRYAFNNAFGIMTADEDEETALQEKEFHKSTITESTAKLKNANTLDELKTAYMALPAAVKKELMPLKEQRKAELMQQNQPKNSPNSPVKTASPEEQQAFLDKEGVEGIPL